MFLVAIVILAIIVGFVRKGNLGNVVKADLKVPYLFALALILFVVIEAGNAAGWSIVVEYSLWMRFVAYLVLITSIFFNIQTLDIWPLALLVGTVMNFMAIFANVGKMPVSEKALAIAGIDVAVVEASSYFELTGASTAFPFLGSIIPIPLPGILAQVISVGTLLIGLGAFGYIQELMLGKIVSVVDDEDENDDEAVEKTETSVVEVKEEDSVAEEVNEEPAEEITSEESAADIFDTEVREVILEAVEDVIDDTAEVAEEADASEDNEIDDYDDYDDYFNFDDEEDVTAGDLFGEENEQISDVVVADEEPATVTIDETEEETEDTAEEYEESETPAEDMEDTYEQPEEVTEEDDGSVEAEQLEEIEVIAEDADDPISEEVIEEIVDIALEDEISGIEDEELVDSLEEITEDIIDDVMEDEIEEEIISEEEQLIEEIVIEEDITEDEEDTIIEDPEMEDDVLDIEFDDEDEFVIEGLDEYEDSYSFLVSDDDEEGFTFAEESSDEPAAEEIPDETAGKEPVQEDYYDDEEYDPELEAIFNAIRSSIDDDSVTREISDFGEDFDLPITVEYATAASFFDDLDGQGEDEEFDITLDDIEEVIPENGITMEDLINDEPVIEAEPAVDVAEETSEVEDINVEISDEAALTEYIEDEEDIVIDDEAYDNVVIDDEIIEQIVEDIISEEPTFVVESEENISEETQPEEIAEAIENIVEDVITEEPMSDDEIIEEVVTEDEIIIEDPETEEIVEVAEEVIETDGSADIVIDEEVVEEVIQQIELRTEVVEDIVAQEIAEVEDAAAEVIEIAEDDTQSDSQYIIVDGKIVENPNYKLRRSAKTRFGGADETLFTEASSRRRRRSGGRRGSFEVKEDEE